MSSQSRPAASHRHGTPAADPGRPSAQARMTQRRSLTPDDRFVPLPPPVGTPPYRRALADVIGPASAQEIASAQRLRFHSVGDTGGHVDPRPQRHVAAAMAAELRGSDPACFLYHLGDVVYPHGEEVNYRPQFMTAYADYQAPIFAVPGNHDGESPDRRLAGFVRTFCTEAPPLHDARRPSRPPSRQPHVYWTLTHELVWVIGLYANVPEGGQFAEDQITWLIGELAAAPATAVVIVAVHQPVYSVDRTHGSNLALADLLDACGEQAGRWPDAVFCGHAHDYQRFTRRRDGREIPYIVAGAGGYPELHEMAHGLPALPVRFDGVPEVTLEAYEDRAHGFMTVTVDRGRAEVVYSAVSDRGVAIADRFAFGPAT